MRVCVAVARRRKGKRVRERVCNKGDRRGFAGRGEEGWQRGRRGGEWVVGKEGNGRGSGAASVFAMRPEYQCQPLFVATAVGRKRFSFSLSLSPFSVARASLSFLAEAERRCGFLTRVNRRFSRV